MIQQGLPAQSQMTQDSERKWDDLSTADRETFLLAAFGGKDEWQVTANALGLDRVVASRIALSLCPQEQPPESDADRRQREEFALHFHGNRTLGLALQTAVARRDGCLHSWPDDPESVPPPPHSSDSRIALATRPPSLPAVARSQRFNDAMAIALSQTRMTAGRAGTLMLRLSRSGSIVATRSLRWAGVRTVKALRVFQGHSHRVAKGIARGIANGLAATGRRCDFWLERLPDWARAFWHDDIHPNVPSDAGMPSSAPKIVFTGLRTRWRDWRKSIGPSSDAVSPSAQAEGGLDSGRNALERWHEMGETTKNMIVASALRGYPPALSFVGKLAPHIALDADGSAPFSESPLRQKRILRAVARGNSPLFRLYWKLFPPIG